MALSLRVFGLLTLASLTAATASAQTGTPIRVPTDGELGRYDLELAWSGNAVMDASRDLAVNIALDEESVYIQTRNGFVTALDAETGTRRWAQLFGRLDTPAFPVVTNQEMLLVVAGMQVYAVNKWNGHLLWKVTVPEQAGSPPTLDAERVYIATEQGSVYAFDLAKIYELHHAGKLPESGHLARLWRHRTSKSVEFPPVVVNYERIDDKVRQITDVVFASQTGILYSVGAGDHKLSFQMETTKPISAPMGKLNSRIFLATGSQHVYCIDVATRKFVWEFTSRSPIRTAPRIIGDRCYLNPTDGTLYCVDVNTGVELWREDDAVDFVGQSARYLFASDKLGNLMLLVPDLETHSTTIAARLPLRQFSIRGTNELTDRVYMCSPNGTVIAIRDRGSSFPLYYKNPEQRPIEPLLSVSAPEPAADATP